MSISEGAVDVPYGPSTWGYVLNHAPAQGTISSAGDADTYKVYLQAGVQYSFYLNESSYPSGVPNFSAYFGLYSPGSNLIGVSSPVSVPGDVVQSMLYTPASSGFYFVNVAGLNGAVGSYYLDVGPSSSSGVVDDHSAYWSSATNLAYNTPTFGRLEVAGDVDGFKAPLTAGQRYYYELSTSVPDLFLALKDANYDTLDFAVSRQAASGSFVAGASGTAMLYLSSNSFVNTGDYYIFLAPTFSNTANLVMGGAANDRLLGTAGQDEMHGSWGADSLSAGAGDDIVFGGPGVFNDSLDGGTGADLMLGGGGNDVYVVDSIGDRVQETTLAGGVVDAGGIDLVRSSVALDLSAAKGVAFVENLTLTGAANIAATGNALANTIIGNAGANRIKGAGGKDVIDGGAGIDTADYSDKAAAVGVTLNGAAAASVTVNGVVEDSIRNIENLLGGSGADSLDGDALANVLKGGGGRDLLNGNGGIDTADYSDKAGAVSVTLSGATSVSVTVNGVAEDSIRNIENLFGGSGADTFNGDALANVFRGGAGRDVLNGNGGVDTADYSDRAGAVAVTLNGATVANVTVNGVAEDTVRNIESLIGGSGADSFTGDLYANRLAGAAGNDTLRGNAGSDTLAGGAGKDALTGGAGADRFVFDTAIGAGNVDTLTDFATGLDKLVLDDDVFTTLGIVGTAGGVGLGSAACFQLGTAANDAGDRLVYDQAAGKLFYDADGIGGAAQVQIALVGVGTTLAAGDILVIA